MTAVGKEVHIGGYSIIQSQYTVPNIGRLLILVGVDNFSPLLALEDSSNWYNVCYELTLTVYSNYRVCLCNMQDTIRQ